MTEPAREGRPSQLDPSWLPVVADWQRNCAARQVPVHIYETRRSDERQAWLYAAGRTRPGPIVTNAPPGKSKHRDGLAIDAVPWEARLEGQPASKLDWDPFVTPAAKAQWESGARNTSSLLDPRWRVMVEEADKLGMDWSGRWVKFREYCHFQAAA